MVSQVGTIQVVESVCGSLSLFASIVMLIKLSSQKSKNFTIPLLLALFSFLLVLSIMLLIGRASFGNAGFCGFQGFMIEWMYMCIMFWDMLMSYLMFTWIVKRQHPKRMDKLIRKNLILIVVLALIVTIITIGTGSISEAYVWCWIKLENPIARFLGFEIFLIIAWLSNCAMLISVHFSLQSRIKRATFHEKIAALMDTSRDGSIQRKLIVYLVIFSIVWFFFLLNRIVEVATNNTYFPTAVLQAFFVSIQGFFYAFVYGGIVKGRLWRIHKKKPVNTFLKNQHLIESDFREEMVEPTPQNMTSVVKATKQFVPKKYSIFSTTFNMGEAPLSKMEQNVKDWILAGHDIYAIGVQECMDLASVRAAIQRHLGGPEKYQMYGIAIGSDTKSLGFHGYIALTVLVKTSEILEGNIQVTIPAKGAMATGADLIVTTAQNKGAVGIPLQIHDTSIGFVTCHLPSDSKGKSKLTKRNASAHAILKEVTLAPEDLGFDLHLQHDHVLVFGDLNYRMDTDGDGGGVNSLTGVAVACGVEKQGYGDDTNWIARKFNLLRHHSDPLYPTISEIKIIHTAKSQAYGAWKSVLRADELRSIMDDGDAFFGFEEPMPAFPPSYKRRKYADADCGDYSQFDTVIKGYSNTGYVENLLSESTRMKKASTSSKLIKGINKHFKGSGSGKRSPGNGLTASALASLSPENNGNTQHNDDDDEETGQQSPSNNGNNNAVDTRSERSNSTVNIEDYEDDGVIPEKEDPSKLRPPSYTDRVLLHSLPDRRERVTIQSYDSCDLVRVSDHRPVAMTLLLEVNSNVFYKETAQQVNSDQKQLSDRNSLDMHAHAKEPQFELYELQIAELSVTLVDLLYIDEDEDDDDDMNEDNNGSSKNNGSDYNINEENPFRASLTNNRNNTTANNNASNETPFASSSSSSLAARIGGNEAAAVNPLHHPRSALARSVSTPTNTNNTTKLSMFDQVEEEETSNSSDNNNINNNNNDNSNNNMDSNGLSQSPPTSRPTSLQSAGNKRSARFADDATEDTGSRNVSGGYETPPSLQSPPMSPSRGDSSSSNTVKKKKKGGIKFVEADSTTMGTTTASGSTAATATASPSRSHAGESIEMSAIQHSKDVEQGEVEVVEVLSPPPPPPATSPPSAAPFNRGDLMKKSRSRSIFGTLTQSTSMRRKSLFQTFFGGGDEDDDDLKDGQNNADDRKTESEDDLIKSMANQSMMMWKGEASGDWRRRVLEEEKERAEREKNNQGQKLIKAVKKKKKKMNQHRIDQITVVFPLPSKDPLLSYRRMYDYAKAFDMDHGKESISAEKEAQERLAKEMNGEFDVENQLREVTTDETAREALLKASSIFAWHAAPVDSSKRASVSAMAAGGTSSSSSKKEAKFDSADKFRVSGCVSVELGAHALVKFTTRTGTELGSSVVCVTHLLHRDPTLIRSSYMTEIPLSSGGQKRGHISGKFSLKYIASSLSSSATGHDSHHHQHHSHTGKHH